MWRLIPFFLSFNETETKMQVDLEFQDKGRGYHRKQCFENALGRFPVAQLVKVVCCCHCSSFGSLLWSRFSRWQGNGLEKTHTHTHTHTHTQKRKCAGLPGARSPEKSSTKLQVVSLAANSICPQKPYAQWPLQNLTLWEPRKPQVTSWGKNFCQYLGSTGVCLAPFISSQGGQAGSQEQNGYPGRSRLPWL